MEKQILPKAGELWFDPDDKTFLFISKVDEFEGIIGFTTFVGGEVWGSDRESVIKFYSIRIS